jgi:hypothetical protein
MTTVDNGVAETIPPTYRRPTTTDDADTITTTGTASMPKSNKENTLITSKLRIFYTIPRSSGMINPIINHQVLLKQLKIASPDLIIIPNDPTIPSYSDLSLLPQDEETFKKHVTVINETLGQNQRITLCHAIKTDVGINDMKLNYENGLLYFLNEHRITIRADVFYREKVETIGMLADAHPDLILRDSLKEDIMKALENR